MGEISHILFDVGEVLLALENTAQEKALSNLVPAEKLEDFLAAYNNLCAEIGRGKSSVSQYLTSISENLGVQISADKFRTAMCEQLGREIFEITDKIDKWSTKFKVCCLSNTNAIHWEYIEKNYSFIPKLDFVFTSHELGLAKPEPEIYKAVQDALNVNGQSIQFFDDSLANVTSAKEFGWSATQVLAPDSVLSKMNELFSLRC